MNKFAGTIALTTALLISAPAFALTVDVGGTGSANSSTGVSVGNGTSVNTRVNANADVSDNANSGSNTGNSADSDTSGSGNTDADATVGATINITRADVSAVVNADADGQVSATDASVTNSASVTNNDNLSAYAKTTVKNDADVNAVEMSDTAVSLGYKTRAKLFGFIPVFVNATATVNADGSTTISYPWYAVFATKDDASLRADVETATASTLSGNVTLSASEKARLLDEMRTAMKSNLQAKLAAEGSAQTSTQ